MTKLLWMDLETTGLNEEKGCILEYAAILTDLKGHAFFEQTAVIGVSPDFNDLYPMNDVVLKMHTESGLLDECEASTISLGDEANKLMGKLRDRNYMEEEEPLHLAGFSIAFDRRWIRKWMPSLSNRLHYRVVDMSLFKVVFPWVWDHWKQKKSREEVAHRAMDDIEAALDFYDDARSWVREE